MRLIRPDWDSLGLAWTASASIRLRRKKRGGGAIDCDDFLHPSRRAPTQTEASHCSRRARHAPAHSSSRLHSVVAWWMHSRSQVIDFRADVLHVYVNIWAWESPAKSSPSTERPDFLRSNRDAGLLGSSIVCKSLQVKTFSTVWNSVPQINSRFRRNKRRRGNKYKRSFHWMNEYRNEHVREGIQSTFFHLQRKIKEELWSISCYFFCHGERVALNRPRWTNRVCESAEEPMKCNFSEKLDWSEDFFRFLL